MSVFGFHRSDITTIFHVLSSISLPRIAIPLQFISFAILHQPLNSMPPGLHRSNCAEPPSGDT